VSLLERLIDTGIYAKDPNTGKYNPRVITKLIRNFRSHPKILEFSDEVFYSGELMAEGSPEITRWACGWKFLPNKSVPIIFEHVIGESEQDDNSPSWYNMREVRRVMFHIDQLMKAKNIFGRKITQNCIGVITPYKKQCQKITIECKKRKWEDIDVGSVEQFQGQEKPVIILSTVRSLTRGVGFLNNPKRLNVALTRAQALLIVVGNVDTLQTDPTWNEFIDFCKGNNLVKKINDIGCAAQKRTKHQVQNQENTITPTSSTREVERVKASSELSLSLPDVPKDDLGRIPDLRKSDDRNPSVCMDLIEKEVSSEIGAVALANNSTEKANAIVVRKPSLGEFDLASYTGAKGDTSSYERCIRPRPEPIVVNVPSTYEFVNAPPIEIHYDVSRARSPTVTY
uniref:DNA2/NAM7 helicase-like C-terminal domain-containing protein n=1 Tax=Phlebotomus papatasi TaxID=29031 RepID=A0A1B0DII1_PHLPP